MPCLSGVKVKLTDFEAVKEAAEKIYGKQFVTVLVDEKKGDDIVIYPDGQRQMYGAIFISQRKMSNGQFEKELYTSANSPKQLAALGKISQAYGEIKLRQFAKKNNYSVQVISPLGAPDIKLKLRSK